MLPEVDTLEDTSLVVVLVFVYGYIIVFLLMMWLMVVPNYLFDRLNNRDGVLCECGGCLKELQK